MGKNDVVRRFDSLHALIDYAMGDTDMPRASRSSQDTYSPGWYGTKSFDDAVALAKEGWSDIRPQVDLLTAEVTTSAKDVMESTVQPVWDVQGAMVDVAAFLNSEPECMIDFMQVEQSRVGRVVTVIAQTAVSHGVSAEAIMKRGAALSALVEALAVHQHSCELWVEISIEAFNVGRGNKTKPTWTCLVRVKGASEMFDVNAFSFALGHPSMFRRLVFSAMERETKGVRERFNIGSGYGHPVKRCVGADEVGADVVVTGMGARSDDPIDVDAAEWLREILNDLGLGRDGE